MSKLIDELNNYDNTTLDSLFKGLKQLKITTLITLITITLSLMSGIFMLGRYSNSKEVVIELEKPFDIKIGNTVELKNVVLVKDHSLVEADSSLKVYDIKQIKDEFNDKVIGQVVINKEQNNQQNWILQWLNR